MHVFLVYFAHILGWFVFGAIMAFIHGRNNTIKISTCVALGLVSATFQQVLEVLGYVKL